MRLSSHASDWLQMLRTRTAASHRAIESQPLLQPLGAGECSHEAYVNALRALAAPQLAMETATAEYSAKNNDALAAYQPLQRMPWLANDLRTLNAKPFELTTVWPECSTPAAYIGILYVREGSRFGAQVIARRLTQLLPTTASSFFSLTDAPSWPTFIESASHYAPNVDAVADVAINIFDALRIHLDRVFVQR